MAFYFSRLFAILFLVIRSGAWLSSVRPLTTVYMRKPPEFVSFPSSSFRLYSTAKTEGSPLVGLINSAKAYQTEALQCLKDSTDSKEVETFRVLFLGKNGKITGLMKEMRSLSNDDKPKLGEVVNVAKTVVEQVNITQNLTKRYNLASRNNI